VGSGPPRAAQPNIYDTDKLLGAVRLCPSLDEIRSRYPVELSAKLCAADGLSRPDKRTHIPALTGDSGPIVLYANQLTILEFTFDDAQVLNRTSLDVIEIQVPENKGKHGAKRFRFLADSQAEEGPRILQIKMLDHVTVGQPEYFSFKEAGGLVTPVGLFE
jgi:hypothetical protein